MNNDHVTGFVTGAACTVFAFYWYQQNKERIDEFVKAQELGLATPLATVGRAPAAPVAAASANGGAPDLAQLMAERERLDDMIAEFQANQEKGKK